MEKPTSQQPDPKESDKQSSNGPEKSQSNEEELDEELDSLLDSSLADFQTYSADSAAQKKTNSESTKPKSTGASGAPVPPPSQNSDGDFMKAFFSGASGNGPAVDFEEHLKSLLQDDPLAMAEFEKLTKDVPGGGEGPAAASQADFASTLAETLSSLSANAESLKTEMTDDELMKSFQQTLNLGGGGGAEGGEGEGGEANFIPMMQNMMSNLLSKEILYPSLKDLADKYPDWLSVNSGKVPKKQLELYARQFDIVSRLCDLYDEEKETDSQEVKETRFEKILDLMTQMQDCGPPPQDIVGQLAPGLNFDAQGNPQLPGMDQCSVM